MSPWKSQNILNSKMGQPALKLVTIERKFLYVYSPRKVKYLP